VDTARPRFGLVLQGGFNTGKTDSGSCEIQAALPESSPTNPWCDTSTWWVTRVTGLGTYTIPRIDVLVAGTFRSDQGGDLAANWAAPNSATVGLNRPLEFHVPGSMFPVRVHRLDAEHEPGTRQPGTWNCPRLSTTS
jgi:hypothetical protein